MRNRFILLMLAITATFNTFAREKSSTATIKGLVKDEKGKVIIAATVTLHKTADSALVKTEITNAGGAFEFAGIANGSYLIRISAVGHSIYESAPVKIAAGQQYELPDIVLQPSAKELSGVVVKGKKPLVEIRADKTVFNVEASINATGSNALELLQKSPGIQVDNNENISMKGKTGVKIYIDGKMMQLDTKDLADYLKSINSNDIEAIEMISNPSAKYDASGNAGIVNIRLKKNKKYGTNGSVNLGLVQGITPKGNASVNLNYRDKLINIFGNVSANQGRYENEFNLYRIQKDTLFDQHSLHVAERKSTNIKAGLDYFLNSKNTVGFIVNTNLSNDDWRSSSVTNISYVPAGEYVKTLRAFNSIPGNRTNSNFNINYRYADTAGREVNFDADYGLFRGTGRSYQPNYYFDKNGQLLNKLIYRNNTPTDIDIYTAKIDAQQNAFKGVLGYGAKFSYVHTKNTFEFYNEQDSKPVLDESRSNRFAYTENVNAAYINYQRQLNKKWSLQAGLRAEQTNSQGDLTRTDGQQQADDNVKRHYLDFFPSGALTFTVNEKNTLNITYSRRIDRPTYQDLNPFENKLDELTYEKGNAFLRPQYTNTIELSHTLLGMINTTVGYSHVKDFATQVTDTANGNATYVQQQNLATQRQYSASIGSPIPIAKWWNGYANVWYNYQLFDGKIGNKDINRGYSLWGAYLQNTFTLGKKGTSAELSGFYNGPNVWGGTWRTKPQGGVDLGLQQQLLKKSATLKVSVTDIFYTMPWSATSNFGGLNIKASGAWESRTLRVNFTYRFGSNNVKQSRQRKTGLETEAGRIK
jgi:hypothetical protein